jgi:hypothetical protein
LADYRKLHGSLEFRQTTLSGSMTGKGVSPQPL